VIHHLRDKKFFSTRNQIADATNDRRMFPMAFQGLGTEKALNIPKYWRSRKVAMATRMADK
jgi:hypothetical protein